MLGALAAALLSLFTTNADAQVCPYTTITTTDIGEGVGFLAPPVLTLGLDVGNCRLTVDVTAPACCNTFPSHHLTAFGRSVFFVPVQLGSPFLPGSELFFFPEFITPLTPGLSSTVPFPTTVSLIGQSIFAQSVPVFFTTIGMTYDLGVTQTVNFVLN